MDNEKLSAASAFTWLQGGEEGGEVVSSPGHHKNPGHFWPGFFIATAFRFQNSASVVFLRPFL